MASEMDEIHKALTTGDGDQRRKTPLPHLAKFSLLGFFTDAHIITLDKDHIIKRVSAKQRDAFYKRTRFGNYKEVYMDNEHMLFYYYSRLGGNSINAEVEEKRKLLTTFFNLLKYKSVNLAFYNDHSKHSEEEGYKSTGFYTCTDSTYPPQDNLKLPKSEIQWVKKLWKNYSSIDLASNKTFAEAIKRFYNSFERVEPKDQILDLSIALEAFFLNRKDSKTYSLAQRTSVFLKGRLNGQQLFKFMKAAYNLRSQIVHGSSIRSKDLKLFGKSLTLKEWAAELNRILRLVLLEYIEHYSALPKSELIKQIDSSIERT